MSRGNLAQIAAVLCDVDGTLTPSSLHYLPDGSIAKTFHVRDGHRMVLARSLGLIVGLVTGRDDACVAARAADLGLTPVFAGVRDKPAVVGAWLAEVGLTWSQLMVIGDDLPDLALMERAGVGVAVGDADPAIKRRADRVTRSVGGGGAVAEAMEWLLRAHGWQPGDSVEARGAVG